MKKQILKELDRELSMRKRVYRTADAKNNKFINGKEQYQYDTLHLTRTIIAAMTESELQQYIKRTIDRNRSEGVQETLFK